MKMTTEEAFVKVLQMHGIEHAFGIIGSAFMPVSDLFPKAGITFWDCAHETNGGLICDGYTRATGKMAMAIAQNGPGVTGFVTAVKTAYWNHTPMLLVTPQAANRTIGQGGFQEVEQMAMFRDMVCYQEEVRDPVRIAEVLNRVIGKAKRAVRAGTDQHAARLLDPGHRHRVCRRSSSSSGRPAASKAIAEAARLLSEAKFPVILYGAGVVIGGAIPDSVALAERLDAPVCCNYQHNDSFPGSHRLAVGPLGYNGSKAAMELIAKADVVLALGTRLNPFSTLAGLRHRLLAEERQDHPGRHQCRPHRPDQEGRRRHLRRRQAGGAADPGAAVADSRRCGPGGAQGADPPDQVGLAAGSSPAWITRTTIPAPTWNAARAQARPRPHVAAPGLARDPGGLPKDAIISTDIGNNCAIGNAYPTFEKGRKYLAPGLFGPCGYGFPSIIGAKIGCPDVPVVGFAGDGAFGISMNEMSSIGREEWPADHHGDLPQLSMGRGEAQLDPVVRQQFRRHRARPGPELRQGRGRLRPQGRDGHSTQAELTEALQEGLRGAEEGRDHLHRGHPQPGARRAFPARRHEEAGRGRRHRPADMRPQTGAAG